MTEFALLNYAEKRAAVPGIKVGEQVLPLAAGFKAAKIDPGFDFTSTKDLLANWSKGLRALKALAKEVEKSPKRFAKVMKKLSSVKLMAPILYPDAVFCAFANYTDHMKEMSGREPPDKKVVKPMFFIKLGAHAIVGPEEKVKLPSHSKQVDWEAELGVVIGKAARNVSVDKAMDHVAGYTILNDLSLRDQGRREDWKGRDDFLSAKSFDTGCPMGPWMVPRDQIGDVYNLTLKQWVAEELMQDSSTSYMHFTIAEQIAYLSTLVTLRPGDVIATGSPSGNGRPRGIYLKPGQDLTIEIEKIGTLHNPIVAGV
jgi:2-keto-4-pentenoate hydratase/2-oxohepta-3-ene-1,7-dioic acid hydratase in catechol pathway